MNQEVLRYADWYWWLYGVNVYELLGDEEEWISTNSNDLQSSRWR